MIRHHDQNLCKDHHSARKNDRRCCPAEKQTTRIEALTAAIGAFQKAMVMPRGQIVNRGTLLKEIATDTAALIEQLRDLDDLVVQFDATDVGKRFVEAWNRARVIIDRVAEIPAKTAATTKTPQPAGAN